MTRRLEINPVTRIEGHAKITIALNDDGSVQDARLHITQFRGFEKFVEGRPFHEMPALMARICGICPVSHLMASAKACDALMAVQIPKTAARLRRVMNLGQIVQSHALSFFHLSSPDLLLGMDADPAQRHLYGVAAAHPTLAKDGIRLRQFGQQVIEWLGGKRIHPSWVVPGGVSEPLSTENRDRILAGLPEARQIILRTLQWYKGVYGKFEKEIASFGNFPSAYMGLVGPNGTWEHYSGLVRVVDAQGQKVAPDFEAAQYGEVIGEAVEPWTYLKFPYLRKDGYPKGIYRVGPLARLNLCERVGTPLGEKEWVIFRQVQKGLVTSSFHYHWARLVEILICLELMEQLLSTPDILSKRVRANAGPNNLEGVGVSEAPRGILFHHYKINEEGLMTWANLIIATGHNNLAMNQGVLQVAKTFVKGPQIPEGMLNRVEAIVRCYDPCLSCSTHAVGRMPLHVELRGADGTLLDEVTRG